MAAVSGGVLLLQHDHGQEARAQPGLRSASCFAPSGLLGSRILRKRPPAIPGLRLLVEEANPECELHAGCTADGRAGLVVHAGRMRARLDSAGEARGRTVRYRYDDAMRLVRVKQGSNPAAVYTYDDGGRRTELALPNGVRTVYTYDTGRAGFEVRQSRRFEVYHRSS